ncbi:hypothetical protein CTAM01_03872 [Colletotrichum tamarilloi]|nr:uncharacterized protein CTAM01_03872 [Colletotrichum tamarilloi]KAK1504565.1 hypothetical protein CTAM01_03872 [Colletotrichum tamarilloi]
MAPLEPLHFCLSVASAWLPLGWRVVREGRATQASQRRRGGPGSLESAFAACQAPWHWHPPAVKGRRNNDRIGVSIFSVFSLPREHPSARGSRIDIVSVRIPTYRPLFLYFRYFPFPCCHASVSYFNHTFGVSTTEGAAIRSGKDVQEWSATIFHLTLQRLISDGFSSENVNIISMPAPLSPMPLSVLDSDSDSDL